MANPEWGTKRICQSCSAPFYDLRRDPIVCPKCSATFDPEAILKSRRRAPEEDAAKKAKEEAKKQKEDEAAAEKTGSEEETDADTDTDTDTEAAVTDDVGVLEDASDLGDDDVSEVVDTGKDKEDT